MLLEGSSDQGLLRDGKGSSQTAEASVNISEWDSATWMENFSDSYPESGPLDNNSGPGQVSSTTFASSGPLQFRLFKENLFSLEFGFLVL